MTIIKVGDRVAFSHARLRSSGQVTDWALFARGTVTRVDDFGGDFSPRLSVATVAWGDHEPTRVNVNDLVREDHIHLSSPCARPATRRRVPA
jgi:hypothetical protein